MTTTMSTVDEAGRCVRTDLLPGECAHCRGLPDVAPLDGDGDEFDEPALPTGRGLFDARYGGACSNCGDLFERGDPIQSDGFGGYRCQACAT